MIYELAHTLYIHIYMDCKAVLYIYTIWLWGSELIIKNFPFFLGFFFFFFFASGELSGIYAIVFLAIYWNLSTILIIPSFYTPN